MVDEQSPPGRVRASEDDASSSGIGILANEEAKPISHLVPKTKCSHEGTKSAEEKSSPPRDLRVLVRDIFLARTPEATIGSSA